MLYIFSEEDDNTIDFSEENSKNNTKKTTKYCCKICNIECSNKTNLLRHYKSITHSSKVMEFPDLEDESILYSCKKCIYKTYQKNDWNNHIKCKKHIKNINKPSGTKEIICNNCNKQYNSRNGLWKHKQNCIVEENNNNNNINQGPPDSLERRGNENKVIKTLFNK